VEIKKVGKVTVLKFERDREFTPERKPYAKRFFQTLRIKLFPCRGDTITSEELVRLILSTFGSDYEYHILISDEWFRVISRDKMEKLLKEDDTDKLTYNSVVSDCDDFSDVLLGCLTKRTWNQGYALGQLWYYNEARNFGHAVNLFCDGEKIWVVEPQNDNIVEWGKDDFYSGKAYMVKF
jgi:hypothetical protein